VLVTRTSGTAQEAPQTACDQARRCYVPRMNRGIIGTIIGILVVIILVLVIMRLA
jgi:hypothetical protein